MDKKRIILGLDVNTSSIGVSLVECDGENIQILKISNVKPKINRNIKGTEALFLKTKQFKEQFIEKYKDIGITDIIIEEPFPKSQNNKMVSTLLRFNGMLSQSIYDVTGIVPVYISSHEARKYAFPDLISLRKYSKNDEILSVNKIREALKNNELVLFGNYPFSCQKKYILWNKVTEMFPYIEWEYDNKGNLKTENFDASDSLICIIGQLNKEKYYNSIPKIIEYNDYVIENNNRNIRRFSYKTEFCEQTFEKIIDIEG